MGNWWWAIASIGDRPEFFVGLLVASAAAFVAAAVSAAADSKPSGEGTADIPPLLNDERLPGPQVGPYMGSLNVDGHRLPIPQFKTDDHQGDFGEAVTSIILASEGWLLLPSTHDGRHGIDGVYVRRTDEPGQAAYEFLVVEVKTVRASNADDGSGGSMGGTKCDQLATAEILRGFEELPSNLRSAWQDETLMALKYAVSTSSPFLRRQLWRVFLGDGIITVTDIGAGGEQLMWRRRDRDSDRAIIQALLEYTEEQFAASQATPAVKRQLDAVG